MPEDNDQGNNAGDGETTPALDPQVAALVAAAKAEVRAEFTGQVDELRRTVGRAQSLAEKAQADPTPDPALQEQLGAVSTILDDLVTGLDPEAIPAELRARIMAT